MERENKGEETAAEQKQAQSAGAQGERREIPSDKILEYLAQANYAQTPQVKPLDVSKYVTPEQAQRIAGSVREYQQVIGKTVEAVSSEFPNLDDSAKTALAVELFNKSNF